LPHLDFPGEAGHATIVTNQNISIEILWGTLAESLPLRACQGLTTSEGHDNPASNP
jgi:hypothetical protein